MATGNFKTMRDFPLIVAGEERCKVCPECGITNAEDAAECDSCGCDLSDVESVNDECFMQDKVREMESKANEFNEHLTFYTVSVESGYYSGVQFYVDEKYIDVEKWSNEDARAEFDMCRSEMLRKYRSEGNWLRRKLHEVNAELGLMELAVSARFSNGEVMYVNVEPNMSERVALKVALNAA